MWDDFLHTFGLFYARHRDVRGTWITLFGIVSSSSIRLVGKEVDFFVMLVFVPSCVFCGLRGVGRVLRGVERGSGEIWSVTQFHVSFWASILKAFCNDMICIVGLPSCYLWA